MTNKSMFKSPREIYDLVGKYVIGQREALSTLSVVAFDHLNRTRGKKSNLLIIGPTGTGKSYMVRKTANTIGVPYAESSITQRSPAGYVGDNIENIFQQIEDAEVAESAVVFLDE